MSPFFASLLNYDRIDGPALTFFKARVNDDMRHATNPTAVKVRSAFAANMDTTMMCIRDR